MESSSSNDIYNRNLPYAETIPHDLYLFTDPIIQSGMTGKYTYEVAAENSVAGSEYAYFRVESHGNEVLLPSETYVKAWLKVSKRDGRVITSADELLPSTGIFSGMVKNVVTKVNNELVETGDNLYAYRAHLEKTLHFPYAVQDKGLDLAYWKFMDSSFDCYLEKLKAAREGEANATTPVLDPARQKLKELLLKNETFTVIDLIHTGLFSQSKVLPPKSRLDVTFNFLKKPAFTLLSSKVGAKDDDYKITIEKMVLKVTKVVLSDQVLGGMLEQWRANKMVRIPLRINEMSYHPRPAGTVEFSEVAAVLKGGNDVPRRIFIAVVQQDAMNGKLNKDPYHFHDVNASTIALKKNGQFIPLPELKCNNRKEETGKANKIDFNDITDFLESLRIATSTNWSPETIGINRLNMSTGNFIVGFKFEPSDITESFQYPSEEKLELTYTLSSPDPDNAYNIIIMAEYDAELRVDNQSNTGVVRIKPWTRIN